MGGLAQCQPLVVGWTGGCYPGYENYFAVLDATYNRVAGPTLLYNPAALLGDGYVSVAPAANRAVLTWMDFSSAYQPSLYHALVDGSGGVLAGPAIFVTGAGGWDGKKGTTQGDAIDKAEFVVEMCAKFSIPASAIPTNFVDVYGTAENGKAQAGFFSTDYGDYVFEVGDDVKMYVVDGEGGLAREGVQGSPRFISPYGVEGNAGACLQQSDSVTVVSLADDGSVKRFTHVARASLASCAYEHAEGVRM